MYPQRTVLLAVCLAGFGAAGGAQVQIRPAPQSQPMPTLPLTQLDERALAADLDNHVFTLTFAQPVPIKDLLLLLVRGTSLSVIPDPGIGGSFIGELKSVTVRQALTLILPPLGLDFAVDGGFIRVFPRQRETRLFDVNYVATERAAASHVGTPAAGATPAHGAAQVSSDTKSDIFGDLAKGVQTLLSDRATFNVDRKAGLLQVTDFPDRLDRVASYLDAVHDRVDQQVRIDARIIELELKDPSAPGIDWGALERTMAGPRGAQQAARPGLTGLRVSDVTLFLAALSAQGTVRTIASPTLVALNNEPAIVRATSQTGRRDDRHAAAAAQEVTLSVTPQVSPDGVVMLSLTPIVALDDAGAGSAVREADTLARVADGETIVLSGFPHDQQIRERRNVGAAGGWFGRGTVVTNTRVEVLILLTPTILGTVPAQ